MAYRIVIDVCLRSAGTVRLARVMDEDDETMCDVFEELLRC